MATYTLTSPQTGREYDVDFDREPTQADVDGIWPQLDAHYATREENKSVLFGVDTLSGIGQALGGLPTTATAAYYRMMEETSGPDEYSPEARAAFDAANAYQARMQQESQDRIMRGEATSAGEAFREVAPSLGTSAMSMGANIGGRLAGKGVGAVAGLIAGAPSGPGALATAGLGCCPRWRQQQAWLPATMSRSASPRANFWMMLSASLARRERSRASPGVSRSSRRPIRNCCPWQKPPPSGRQRPRH
jgi:hypothetical protein